MHSCFDWYFLDWPYTIIANFQNQQADHLKVPPPCEQGYKSTYARGHPQMGNEHAIARVQAKAVSVNLIWS